jgi:DUF1680 family protein
MPSGWIKAQMERDLREGFAGHLDELAPEVQSDIFVSGRNTPAKPNVTAAGGEESWWNGESEGNWRTGYIMMAYLSGDEEAKRNADVYVAHILQAQDKDGYIGIYGPQLRFSASPLNGELWTQACILRGLLAYYELTGKVEVLDAVERAVGLTMSKYGPGKMTVFGIKGAAGGIFHGLMFVDVVERLFDLTGNTAYRDFGVWLYQDFCAGAPSDLQDVTVASLLDLHKPWIGHGVHTYEHIRALLWAYYSTGNPEYHQAYENALIKFRRYEFPSGAAVSMEHIGARQPDPTLAYYEYCAMKEELGSFSSGLQKTGAVELGDTIEKLMFNAAQGARSAHGKGIAYCTRDNRYSVDRGLLGRDKFSPTHSDAAVCCIPNATQILPIYVWGMWMRTPEDGLAALLYGPSNVRTNINGIGVQIEEKTDYPFSPAISLTVSPDQPVEFPLMLRNPGWSKSTKVTCQGAAVSRKGDYFVVRKKWAKGDQVRIGFDGPITRNRAMNREVYLQRGPLVYGLRIPENRIELKRYSVPGFEDLAYLSAQGAEWYYALDPAQVSSDYGFILKRDENANLLYPFDGAPLRLEGKMINLDSGKPESVSLIPMGSSLAILRRVTFPIDPPQEKQPGELHPRASSHKSK